MKNRGAQLIEAPEPSQELDYPAGGKGGGGGAVSPRRFF